MSAPKALFSSFLAEETVVWEESAQRANDEILAFAICDGDEILQALAFD